MAGIEQIGLDAALGQAGFGAGETVISGYFAGQMAGMLLTGHRARQMGRDHNQRSLTFQQELNAIRQAFNDKKSQAEVAFLKECHESGMAYQRENALKSCENRRQEEDFRKFCETSWLTHFRPEIGSVLEAMSHPRLDENGVPEMKLLLARTPMVATGRDRKGAYADYCEDFKDEYLRPFQLNIDSIWLRSWERDCVSAMADTMNLHYIMQGIPAMVLYPIQRGDTFSLETAAWGYQLGPTGMAFEKTFRVPITEISADPFRLDRFLLAAAAYSDDCYRIMLCQSVPESLYKIKDYIYEDEIVWPLLCQKYQALIDTTDAMRGILLIEDHDIEQLKEVTQL